MDLRDDVMHGGICGGPGNVRVHGGIFDSIAIESTNKLTYKSSASLARISTEHKREHNVRGQEIDYSEATDLLGEKVSNKLKKMVGVMRDEYITPNGFFSITYLQVHNTYKKISM